MNLLARHPRSHDSVSLGLLALGLGLLLAAGSTGCSIYFDDNPDDCAAALLALEQLRDPSTGECVDSYSGGSSSGSSGVGPCGRYGTGGTSDPSGGAEAAPQQAAPDWGSCYAGCEGLAEAECATSPVCRVIYLDALDDSVPVPYADSGINGFYECWSIAPSGPAYGECRGLDAHTCSRYPGCVAHHMPQPDGTLGPFSYCAAGSAPPTPECYSDLDCGADERCNAGEICLSCGNTTASGDCACGGYCVPTTPQPTCWNDYDCADDQRCTAGIEDCLSPDGSSPVPGAQACQGYCVPETTPVGTCNAPVICDATPPACPAGTAPGITEGCWSGYCIPFEACVPPIDPGHCFDSAVCEIVPPTCPDGSVPGIANHCYTGFCIPADHCEYVACEQVTAEAACIARSDCSPYYEGEDCSCTGSDCTCVSWGYLGCSTDDDTMVPFP